MQTPFTAEQFFSVFKAYNEAISPILPILFALALMIFLLAVVPGKITDQVLCSALSFLWLWMGVVYHIIFFSAVNKAAYLFGTMFIAQGILFLVYGVFRSDLAFRLRFTVYAVTGIVFILYSLIVYPIIGTVIGHRFPSSPTFGLPCPTTIFTFGILLLTVRRVPAWILVIPVIWSVIGFGAVLMFGMYEDIGLLVASVTTCVLLLYRDRIENKPAEKKYIRHYRADIAIQEFQSEEQ
jgi:hypothetical protein